MKFTLLRFDEVNSNEEIYPSSSNITFPEEGVPVTLDGEVIGKIYEDYILKTKDRIDYDSCSLTYRVQQEWERILEERIKKLY
jgi:hypothetical protein